VVDEQVAACGTGTQLLLEGEQTDTDGDGTQLKLAC
jgi:hypothetical protein